jgi:superfamily II DNA or RNA helicase
MNTSTPSDVARHAIHLACRRGRLRAWPWPAQLPPPAGCQLERGDPARLDGPASRHAAVRRALAIARMPIRDEVAPPAALPVAIAPPVLDAATALAWQAFRGHGRRGLVTGLDDGGRTRLLLQALAQARRAALVLAPASSGVDGWLAALRPHLGEHVGAAASGNAPAAVTVATYATFAPLAERLGDRFRLVVADGCDRVPWTLLQAVLLACTATQRLGLPGHVGPGQLELGSLLGPLVHFGGGADGGAHHVVYLPLAADERHRYSAAWSQFLCAYDHFMAIAPGAPFRDFVAHARADARSRPGLLAWHRALQELYWTRAKAAAALRLREACRGQRLLFFTGDCASAYALARSGCALAVTAELPAAERRAALSAWANGDVPALCGPRLLEEAHGLPPADVGVIVGSAFGSSQRQARRQRVRAGGQLFEFVAADTVEVGRARRSGDGARG